MTDDIVTRLREYEAITDNAYVINALVAAADEIERLRAELEEIKSSKNSWEVRFNASFGKEHDADTLLEALTKALNNERT